MKERNRFYCFVARSIGGLGGCKDERVVGIVGSDWTDRVKDHYFEDRFHRSKQLNYCEHAKTLRA